MSDLTPETVDDAVAALVDAANDARAAAIEGVAASGRDALNALEKRGGEEPERAAPVMDAMRAIVARSESTLSGVADLLTGLGHVPKPKPAQPDRASAKAKKAPRPAKPRPKPEG
jgi:hypothetical protein